MGQRFRPQLETLEGLELPNSFFSPFAGLGDLLRAANPNTTGNLGNPDVAPP
jgi:hypothetical protein